VYRNGIDVGYDRQHRQEARAAPTGIFTILQKDKNHHSSKYNTPLCPTGNA
jgi:hypothetical protein